VCVPARESLTELSVWCRQKLERHRSWSTVIRSHNISAGSFQAELHWLLVFLNHLTDNNDQLCQLRVRKASMIGEGLLVEVKNLLKAKHPHGTSAVQSTFTGVKFLPVQDIDEQHPEFGERLHRSGLGNQAQSQPACNVQPPASATSQASEIRKVRAP
jgi:hypothetical protein